MIQHYKFSTLGHHELSWLDTHYHFSFSDYYNSKRMNFGALRVINDDIIKAGAGFDTHPHKDMEIITYIRKGAITHHDSRGNEGRTEAGSVQVMSAGSGIYHSEFNLESEDTHLFQIWIYPREEGVQPRWDSLEFPKTPANAYLPLLVSGFTEDKEKNALYINQDARIFGGTINKDHEITHNLQQQAYLLVSDGKITIGDTTLNKGDGAEIIDQNSIIIKALEISEIIIIEIPPLRKNK